MPSLDAYLDQNAARFEDDLCQLLRIPSVSADRRAAAISIGPPIGCLGSSNRSG